MGDEFARTAESDEMTDMSEQFTEGETKSNELGQQLAQEQVQEAKQAEQATKAALDKISQEQSELANNQYTKFMGDTLGESKINEKGVSTALSNAAADIDAVPGDIRVNLTTPEGTINYFEAAHNLNDGMSKAGILEATQSDLHREFTERMLNITETMGSDMSKVAADMRTEIATLRSELGELSKDRETTKKQLQRIMDSRDALEKRLNALENNPEVRKVMEKAAADSKSTTSRMWERFKSLLKALLWLSPIGFLLFFMIQYAADHTGCFHTGCFVFSDTVSAKLACNDGATPITEKDCVCGGYTPDLKCNAAIDTDQTTCDKPGTTLGTQPPSVCELSINPVQRLEHNPHLYVNSAI
jgi:hypothetical protein